MEEEETKLTGAYELGRNLDDFSVGELDELEAALAAEIERVRNIKEKKKTSLEDANSIFRL